MATALKHKQRSSRKHQKDNSRDYFFNISGYYAFRHERIKENEKKMKGA